MPVLVSGGVVGVVSVEPPPWASVVVLGGGAVVVVGVVCVGVLVTVALSLFEPLEPPQPATASASATADARIVVRIRGMIGAAPAAPRRASRLAP